MIVFMREKERQREWEKKKKKKKRMKALYDSGKDSSYRLLLRLKSCSLSSSSTSASGVIIATIIIIIISFFFFLFFFVPVENIHSHKKVRLANISLIFFFLSRSGTIHQLFKCVLWSLVNVHDHYTKGGGEVWWEGRAVVYVCLMCWIDVTTNRIEAHSW